MSRGVNLSQGEVITLAALAARTVGANGAWVFLGGERRRFVFLLDVTASATAAGDTLDVYIDVSLDGTNLFANAIHFAQQSGVGAAKKEYAVLDASAPGAVTIVATTDAAAGVVRPALFGAYYRARWAIVDGGGGDSSHTFSVIGYGV